MGLPASRSIIVLPFPFSDLSNSKLRLAVVLAAAGRGDFVKVGRSGQPRPKQRQ